MAQKCPGCRAPVPDGTSICPRCDYIIDDSFLSSEPPSVDADGDDPTPARGTAAPKRASKPAEAPTRIKSMHELEEDRVRRAPTRRRGRPEPEPEEAEPEPQGEPEPAEDWRQPAGSDPPDSTYTGDEEASGPERQLGDIKRFVSFLPTWDKLAIAGAALNILASVFPWKETAEEGSVLGITSLGFPVALLSIGVIAAVVIRVKGSMPKLNPAVPWLFQLSAMGACILWCLVFIKLAWIAKMTRSPVGNFEVAVSRPAFGVALAIVASLLGLGGTVMGLRQREQ
ncbi:MAG: hypothetical protein HYZ28_08730 [Myxococcales bacterium]|nr:hypothetical protein [Myxococcales bacterium]